MTQPIDSPDGGGASAGSFLETDGSNYMTGLIRVDTSDGDHARFGHARVSSGMNVCIYGFDTDGTGGTSGVDGGSLTFTHSAGEVTLIPNAAASSKLSLNASFAQLTAPKVYLKHGSDNVVQTVTPAAGGLQVINDLTGAGLERVLTESDIPSSTPEAVTGYTASTATYHIDETYQALSIDSVTGTWTSIGPTGSGADLIWAALDVLPDDTKSLKMYLYSSINPSADSGYTRINARGGDSTAAFKTILKERGGTSGKVTETVNLVEVQVGAGKIFEVSNTRISITSSEHTLNLAGFTV